MCGLLFQTSKKGTEKDFKEALASMHHRGPDAMQSWTDGKTTRLGLTRLSIQDLDPRSNQPFFAANHKHVIVFNGEIYNFQELKKQFDIKTRTTSDTEVLVELFVKLGEKMLDHLNGMFAFVILNTETKEIFAARDRLGIKPLYMYQQDKELVFSSEIRAVLKLANKQDFDPVGIRQYLKARAFFNGHTLYKNIKMFPAGYYYRNGHFYKYWSLPTKPKTREWLDDEIRDLVESAVEYRCIADVPVGSYLSGGVDSTIVATLTGKPDTWTVGFEEMNEFEWGRLAADKLGVSHNEILLDRDEFLDLAKMLVEVRQEPLSVPNEVLIYKMSKAVKKKNTVVLSGEGADELFYGYDRIFRWANEGKWDLSDFDEKYSYGKHVDNEILINILEPYEGRKDCLDKVSAFFQIGHLHGLLRRLDNSTMMCSVEARVPFVDHRLIEYMYGAPVSYRMAGGVVKHPLKQIFSDILPKEIINRRKVGFPVPLAEIFSTKDRLGMDSWLDFNMNLLVGENWPDYKEELFNQIEA
ncbi:MAG: asparagine synthase (glutamine-hydrolyzing) [Proteobacteria bacterium]|nr:asparagine synthase (glutamine-hydrolyzing) [Pseudomonadota bacterium]